MTLSGQPIEVVFIATDQRDKTDYFGYELWIEFLDWHIVVAVKENEESTMPEEIRVLAKEGDKNDVTEDFFMFRDNDNPFAVIQTTGINLYQVMDVLKTNYLKKKDEIEGKS